MGIVRLGKTTLVDLLTDLIDTLAHGGPYAAVVSIVFSGGMLAIYFGSQILLIWNGQRDTYELRKREAKFFWVCFGGNLVVVFLPYYALGDWVLVGPMVFLYFCVISVINSEMAPSPPP